jgi:hypothetical protein
VDIDFPAAHSQDTSWFAVDEEGHVGLFFTCEDGHYPEAVAPINAHQLLGKMWAQRQKAGPETAEEHYPQHREDLAARLGLFYYKHRDEVPVGDDQILIGRYRRLVVAKDPIHVDQLAADLRRACKTIRFEKATFTGSEHLQPLDDHPCSMWNPNGAIAYLSADGTTVRPTPGHEEKFADFCSKLREEAPKFAATVRFEAPPKKRGKKKRKGPEGRK